VLGGFKLAAGDAEVSDDIGRATAVTQLESSRLFAPPPERKHRASRRIRVNGAADDRHSDGEDGTAIDRDHGARDVGGGRGQQECRNAGELLGLAVPAQRNVLRRASAYLVGIAAEGIKLVDSVGGDPDGGRPLIRTPVGPSSLARVLATPASPGNRPLEIGSCASGTRTDEASTNTNDRPVPVIEPFAGRASRSLFRSCARTRASRTAPRKTLSNAERHARSVVAVEPSAVMKGQRPAGVARAVQASAEALPSADRSCDAVMAVLSDHHWRDRRQGLRQLRRVARGRVIGAGQADCGADPG
jgi:Methyltransferase domain